MSKASMRVRIEPRRTWPVALAVTRQGSHRSGRARISASGSSTDSHRPQVDPVVIQSSDGDMLMNRKVFGMFPSIESASRRFAFLHRVLRGKFPCFNSTIKTLRRPAAIPPHFVAFVWRYLNVHSLGSLPGGRVHRRSLELVTRYLQPGVR